MMSMIKKEKNITCKNMIRKIIERTQYLIYNYMINNHNYTRSIKLILNKNQKETIDFWFRKCKNLYNVALQEKIYYYQSTTKYLNVYEQKKELVDVKDFDETFKDVPNKALQEIIFRVDKAYQGFFKGMGFPKYKSELNSIEFVKEDIRLKNGLLYLPKIKTVIKTTEEIKPNWLTVKVKKENDNYFIILLYKEAVISQPKKDLILGVDLGLKDLYSDSNGVKSGRFPLKLIKKYQERIAELNKSLSTKKKGSNRFKKVKKHLGETYSRLKDTRNDFLHKKANQLTNCDESYIALGDIKVQSIIDSKKSKKGLVKSFYNNSLSIFKNYVSYKAIKKDKTLLKIDERNTSRTCSCCGNINNNLKLSDRIYHCLECENSIDRDVNAAINMKLLGSSILSFDKVVLM